MAKQHDGGTNIPGWIYSIFFENRITSLIAIFALPLVIILPFWFYWAYNLGFPLWLNIVALIIVGVAGSSQIRDLGPQGAMLVTFLNDWVYIDGLKTQVNIAGGKWGVPYMLGFGLDEDEETSTGTFEIIVEEFEALSKDDIPLWQSLRGLAIVTNRELFATLEVDDPRQEAAIAFKTGLESVIRQYYYDERLPNGLPNNDDTLKNEKKVLGLLLETSMVSSFLSSFGLTLLYTAVLGPSPRGKFVEQKQDIRNKKRSQELFKELVDKYGPGLATKIFALNNGQGKIIDISGSGSNLAKAAAMFKEL